MQTQAVCTWHASVFHAFVSLTVSLKQGRHIMLSLFTAMARMGIPPTQDSLRLQLPLCPRGGTTDVLPPLMSE